MEPNVTITDADRRNYYHTALKYYPKCKLREYITLKKNIDLIPYASVKSKQQVNTIIKYANTKTGMIAYHRLFSLLGKFIHVKDYPKLMQHVIDKENDEEVYLELRKYLKNYLRKSTKEGDKKNLPADRKSIHHVQYKCDRNILHAQMMFYHIRQHIKGAVIDNYLDIGCGDCIKSKYIGELIGLPIEKIYGADIEAWGGYSDKTRDKDINFIKLVPNEPFPVDSGKFSLISTFMVIHHIKNLNLFMRELNRCLKMGGHIIIREHDTINNMDKMLADIEHGIYEVTYRNNLNYFDEFYSYYYDWVELDIIFFRYGFKYVYADYEYSSVYANISPTRYFYAIYQKIKNL